jgi:hypothetical protein
MSPRFENTSARLLASIAERNGTWRACLQRSLNVISMSAYQAQFSPSDSS